MAKAQKSIADLYILMPAQKELRVFDMFPPNEWITSKDHPGKVMAGVLYLQHYSAELTPAIKTKLTTLSKTAHPLLKAEIQKLIDQGESR